MTSVFNNLPHLTSNDKEKQVSYRNNSNMDAFTVVKCPLMNQDNFENMNPSIWNKLIGAPIQFKQNETNAMNAHLYTINGPGKCMGDTLCMLSDSNKEVKTKTPNTGTLPKIYGITTTVNDRDDKSNKNNNNNNNNKPNTNENDEDDETEQVDLMMKLSTPATLYIGALSIVGLFALYRVVKKTI